MKQTINRNYFVQAFADYNRTENFTVAGRLALYDYLTELEEDTGTEIDLDVIALCCEYSEYANLKEFQDDYGTEYETIDDLRDETTVIMVDDESFIIQQF